jgi:MFS family permease
MPAEPAPRSVVAAVSLSAILAPLNSTMIAVGLPEILHDFDAAVSSAAWLVTGYLAALALLQPVMGRVGDRHGHRPLLLWGLCVFGAASLGASLAPELPMLVSFRILQGIASAAIVPSGFALIGNTISAERRGASLGIVAVAVGAAAAAGPAIGGALAAAAGWRAIFVANLPLTAAALALVARLPPRPPRPLPHARSLAALIRLRAFAAASCSVALGNLAFYTTLLATPILLRTRLGWSSGEIGGAMTALTAPSLLVGQLGGRIADRRGRRLPAACGHACMAAGLLPLALADTRPSILLAGLAVGGTGFALTIAPLQAAALDAGRSATPGRPQVCSRRAATSAASSGRSS